MRQGNTRELIEFVVERFTERGVALLDGDSRSEDFDNVVKSVLGVNDFLGNSPDAFRKELKKNGG